MSNDNGGPRPPGDALHTALRLLGSVVLAGVLVALVTAAMPPFKTPLGIRLDAVARAWITYARLLSEILLVTLFGGAIFSEHVGVRVRDYCREVERRNKLAFAADVQLASDLATVERFWTGRAGGVGWAQLGPFLASVHRLQRRGQSYGFLLRMLIFGVARALPGGIYGGAALVLACLKFGADIVLMQDLAGAGGG